MRDDYERHIAGTELLATEVFTGEHADVDNVLTYGRPPAPIVNVTGDVVIAHERVRTVVLDVRGR